MSRDGKSRKAEANEANDHDTNWQSVLVPFGILNTQNSQLSIYFGKSAETSDFIVDCLTNWWKDNKQSYSGLKELVIDLDGGSATRSNRTQFVKRMVQFSSEINLKIRLIYYPPYHSKYNPIERCWAALENYWNGGILDSVEAAISWASNMTWQGLKPIVHCIETIYEKGIKVSSDELEEYKEYWRCSELLPKWDVTILPS